MINDYHFVTRWRFRAGIGEVADVLADPLSLPRWWPSVYLEVKERAPKVVDLLTKGWLPYTLRWTFTVTESDPPAHFRLDATGDFTGRGIWTLRQDGDFADVTYDWKIRAQKPLLRLFSFVLKPIFAANHRWAMGRGEESLALELRRRRGEPDVPPPPPATFTRWRAGRAPVTLSP